MASSREASFVSNSPHYILVRKITTSLVLGSQANRVKSNIPFRFLANVGG